MSDPVTLDLDWILKNAGLDSLGPDSDAGAFQRFFQRVRLDLQGSCQVDGELASRLVETFLMDRGIPDAARLVAQGLVSLNHNGRPVAFEERPGLTHIRDLLAEPDDAVSWIVDGLLPAGGMSVLAGKPKGGKSTLARALALRVSRGQAVLSRDTTRGPVIYLGLEDPRRVTKNHLRILGARPEDDLYVFTGARPDEAMLWLEGVLAKVDPVLVIVDTLQHLLNVSDLNDYARVVTSLRPVLALVRGRRAHMVLVHHAGKGERTGFDAVLGSTGIVGTADTVLLVRRREDGTRTLATMQRTGEDVPESVLTLDAHREPRLGGTRQEYDTEQAGERILAFLESQDRPVTEAEIEAGVEGRTGDLRRALRALVEATPPRVVRAGEGKRGAPYCYSRSLVPPYTREQENKKPETRGKAPDSATIARSASTGVPSTDSKQRERETAASEAALRLALGTIDPTGWDATNPAGAALLTSLHADEETAIERAGIRAESDGAKP